MSLDGPVQADVAADALADCWTNFEQFFTEQVPTFFTETVPHAFEQAWDATAEWVNEYVMPFFEDCRQWFEENADWLWPAAVAFVAGAALVAGIALSCLCCKKSEDGDGSGDGAEGAGKGGDAAGASASGAAQTGAGAHTPGSDSEEAASPRRHTAAGSRGLAPPPPPPADRSLAALSSTLPQRRAAGFGDERMRERRPLDASRVDTLHAARGARHAAAEHQLGGGRAATGAALSALAASRSGAHGSAPSRHAARHDAATDEEEEEAFSSGSGVESGDLRRAAVRGLPPSSAAAAWWAPADAADAKGDGAVSGWGARRPQPRTPDGSDDEASFAGARGHHRRESSHALAAASVPGMGRGVPLPPAAARDGSDLLDLLSGSLERTAAGRGRGDASRAGPLLMPSSAAAPRSASAARDSAGELVAMRAEHDELEGQIAGALAAFRAKHDEVSALGERARASEAELGRLDEAARRTAESFQQVQRAPVPEADLRAERAAIAAIEAEREGITADSDIAALTALREEIAAIRREQMEPHQAASQEYRRLDAEVKRLERHQAGSATERDGEAPEDVAAALRAATEARAAQLDGARAYRAGQQAVEAAHARLAAALEEEKGAHRAEEFAGARASMERKLAALDELRAERTAQLAELEQSARRAAQAHREARTAHEELATELEEASDELGRLEAAHRQLTERQEALRGEIARREAAARDASEL